MTFNPNSILDSVKKVLLLDSEYDVFDFDIMMHINSTFATLTQLGVGPKKGYMIETRSNLWDEFLQNNLEISSAKSYIFAKVRLLFDPPPNSFLVTSLEKICSEYEYRLLAASEGAHNE